MVEQPKFYYKVVPLKTEKIEGTENGYHLRKVRYYISDTPKPGFKIHPAFVRNGIEVDKIYLAAYEGCIQDMKSDVSSVAYIVVDNSQIANFDEDRLCSLANVLPATGTTQALTRANARKLAHNRGAGWELSTIQSISATQLLFIIEYATFNSQEAIGRGVVNTTESIKTGSTSALGNASGSVESGGVSYRGEENLWGNAWSWCDGISIYAKLQDKISIPYISDCEFSDNPAPTSKYQNTGIENPINAGLISSFGFSHTCDWAFIPCEYNGNTALPVGDKYWNNVSHDGWHVSIIFGGIDYNAESGMFTGSWYWRSGSYKPAIGARLTYFPQNTEEVTSE